MKQNKRNISLARKHNPEGRVSKPERIRTKYSSATDKILCKSLEKMSHASENNLIEYLVLKCA